MVESRGRFMYRIRLLPQRRSEQIPMFVKSQSMEGIENMFRNLGVDKRVFFDVVSMPG
jgi:hypothetical protein